MLDDREQFILNYATNFLAAYAGVIYSDACVRDEHERLAEKAPIEDAFEIAETIWEHSEFQDQYKKLGVRSYNRLHNRRHYATEYDKKYL